MSQNEQPRSNFATQSHLVPPLCRGGIIALAACFAAANAVAEDDQIYLREGSGVSGKVAATTPVQVSIETRGGNKRVSVNEIRTITFGDEPNDLRVGRARALNGQYDAAVRSLERVDAGTIERPIVQQDLQYFLAYSQGKSALTTGGDQDEASTALLSFVRAAPKSHHFFAAAKLLGDLAVGKEDYGAAVKFYGAISSKAPWVEYQMDAGLAEARAFLDQSEFTKAKEKLRDIIAETADSVQAKRQKEFAKIALGRCLAESETPEAGIALIEQVILKNDDTDAELFGRAYNALGHCLQRAGKTKEAMMAYLHVDVLFYSDPQVHAESLYHLAELWTQLKESDRAAQSRQLLQQRYSGSVWARK